MAGTFAEQNLSTKTLARVEAQPTDSPFWKGLMRVKESFFARGYFKIGNGKTMRFWEDSWLGSSPLKDQYPLLYNIVHHKDVSVQHVLHNMPPMNMSFRRLLSGNKWELWSH